MNQNNINFLTSVALSGDSYKYSHSVQYPEGTTGLFSYIEARGTTTDIKGIQVSGWQGYVKKLLSIKLTHEDIDFAKNLLEVHGEPFNAEAWRYIVDTYNGYLPIRIRAVREGTFVPLSNVIVTCESLDPNVAWIESFIETALLRAIWYPTTVGTNSFHCKQLIYKALQKSSDDPDGEIGFKLHDFGARGVSSLESAAIGGAAHLINFLGTDTVSALVYAMDVYHSGVPGFSIPAAEHSTITSWGKEREYDAYANMVKQYAKPGAIFAVVSDSYDIFNAVENIWIGGGLLAKVKEAGAKVVIRPDSGDPTRVPVQIIEMLCDKYGYTMNSKGYKVLPPEVRVIQGDGITPRTLQTILENLLLNGYSASNLAFGMGGGLLQMVNRDTFQFAMKASAAKVNGEWIDVYKQPKTDSGKNSKRGRITLMQNTKTNEFRTERLDGEGYQSLSEDWKDALITVYENGPVPSAYATLDEVRAESNKYL